MENYQYETIIETLVEKVRALKAENGYLNWKKDELEKKIAEIEEGVKQDGTAD